MWKVLKGEFAGKINKNNQYEGTIMFLSGGSAQ